MKNESFTQLFIEFPPVYFSGAILWLPWADSAPAAKEGEVVAAFLP